MKARPASSGITRAARAAERALRGDDKGTVLHDGERNIITCEPHELFYYRDGSGHEGQRGTCVTLT